MNEEELYKIYSAHRQQGASHDDAMKAVELAQNKPDEDPSTLAAERRLSASGDSPTVGALKDTGMMALNGALLNTPELVSEEWKQRSRDLRKLAPGASFAAELAGGAVAPVAVGGRAMVAGKGMAGGLVRAAVGGGAAGGAMGEVAGIADGDGTLGERALSALPGAAAGAVLGAGAGAAPVLLNGLRRFGGPEGPRIARAVREGTGIQDDLLAARNKADAAIGAAGDAYKPVAAANQSVKDPAVLKLLAAPEYEKAVARVEPGGFGLTMRSGGGQFQKGQLPSMEQLQSIGQSLQGLLDKAKTKGDTYLVKKLGAMVDDFDAATNGAIPGKADLDKAYAKANTLRGAIDTGYKTPANKAAADLSYELQGAFPEQVQGTRIGLVNRIAEDAPKNGAWLQRIMTDPEAPAILRQLFPDEPDANRAYAKLLQQIGQERSAAGVGKVAPIGSLGLGSGGVYGLLKLRQKL